MSTASFYAADLAWIHHHGYGNYARQASPWLVKTLRSAGLRRGVIVDLACGSGIWARAASRAGFEVIGVDQSAEMLKLARQVAPGCRFYRGSLHEFPLPPCNAITVIGEGLGYLPARNSSDSRISLRRFFRRAHDALAPGGMLIFDVLVTGRKKYNSRNWGAGKDWACMAVTTEFPAKRLLTRSMIFFRRTNGGFRRGEEAHRVRLFEAKEIESELRKLGFRVRRVDAYGKQRMLVRRKAFVATKR